jgi:hypothetical protein
MRRSGNHAVIDWLRGQERCLFFNNIINIEPILEGRAFMPPPEDYASWLRRNSRKKFGWLRALKTRWGYGGSVIVSLEDHDLAVKPFVNLPVEFVNVLILREPRNLFASRIRKASVTDNPAYKLTDQSTMRRAVELWKAHAKEFAGATNHLVNKTCVLFDRWFADEQYRLGLSRALGLECTDHDISRVSKKGGGSSFDGIQFDGNARAMDVLNRQRYLDEREQEVLQEIFQDAELSELSRIVQAT